VREKSNIICLIIEIFEGSAVAGLNYKHLHYFWVVAKSGSIARAGERLHLTPQTISGQITLFEDLLGYKLFARVGRRLELTDAGRVVLSYADEIFSLGEELKEVLRQRPAGRPLQFRVGVCDIVPKSIAFRLLEPALHLPEPLRIHCREGKLAALLADLAVHRLDIVLSDSPMPGNINVQGYNHLLGESGFTFFASPALAKAHRGPFPRRLNGAAFLLPGEDTVARTRLVQWFEKERIQPRFTGDFDDTALLKAFGEAGAGIFAAPSVTETEVCQKYGVTAIGRTKAVTQQFFVISVERRLTHPAVVAISDAAHCELFRQRPRPRKTKT
jgi:LysR family transcriptional regulator, transcriptional activator of nhaA